MSSPAQEAPPPSAGEAAAVAPPARPDRPRNRIQVSREKRPLNFFVGLAKKFLANEDEVELSGLGLAVTTVVTVVEILRNSGYVVISKIATSLVEMQSDGRGNTPKAKIQIWIRKGEKFPVPAADGAAATAAAVAPAAPAATAAATTDGKASTATPANGTST